MAAVEYLNNSSFYFEVDGITALFLKGVSGPEITFSLAGADEPIGCSKGGVTQTHAVIGGVEYNDITLTYVGGNEGEQKKLSDWYNQCHSESYSGGANKGRDNRKNGKLAIYDGGGKVCMEFTFTDMFPADITSGGGTLAVDGGGSRLDSSPPSSGEATRPSGST
jgi:hypothetical protein